jgi:NAD(P)-dependent dehydrogenase (short-subunit alcohol dehydrogenase family)
MNLQDKVIIVTGAGRGLGKAIALTLAKEKPKLALLARTQSELESVAASVKAFGAEALVLPTDLRSPEHITKTVKQVLETYGSIDVLINNAGFSPQLRPVINTRLEDWEHVFELNARAPFLLSQACLPTMTEKRSGHIVNIVTAAVDVEVATISSYRASKAALRAFAECMREEVKEFGIKVTNVLPEPLDTPMRWSATPDFPKEQIIAPEEVAAAVLSLLNHKGHSFFSDLPIRKSRIR